MKFAVFVLTFCAAAVVFCFAYLMKEEKKMPDIADTDPELAALWDNFINNDVLTKIKLEDNKQYLIVLAAQIAAGSPNGFKLVLQKALRQGISPIQAREVVYQAIPYIGMARVYQFINAANEAFAEEGINLRLQKQLATTPENRLEKGLFLQKSIFGDVIDAMRDEAPQDLKHIQDFLSANCFGDYYTRGGLDIKTRELLTFSYLVSLGGAENQVKGHIRGNISVGNGRQVLIDTVTVLLPYIGYPRSLNAISAINEITGE